MKQSKQGFITNEHKKKKNMATLAQLKELIEKRNQIKEDTEKNVDAANKELEKIGVIAEISDMKTMIVAVRIDFFGDWKHDHGYTDYIMEKNGFKKINETITDEDGSDCYASIHYYHI